MQLLRAQIAEHVKLTMPVENAVPAELIVTRGGLLVMLREYHLPHQLLLSVAQWKAVM